jgi:hypothetical protein
MEAPEETTRSILVHAHGPHPLVQNSVCLERGRFMAAAHERNGLISPPSVVEALTGEDPIAPGSR